MSDLTFRAAQEIVLESAEALEPELTSIDNCLGLVLAEEIFAPEDVPPFTNSAMDGFALRAEDTLQATEKNPVALAILGDTPAGSVFPQQVCAGTAVRIMTGAPLPPGADTVIKVEDTRADDSRVIIFHPVKKGSNVRIKGEDLRQNERILASGTILRAAQIGVCASLGYSLIHVYPRVKVAIVTTGDELVPIKQKPGPGQIRDSNLYTLRSQVLEVGGIPLLYPRIPDQRQEVLQALTRALENADVVLTSGGVSVGKYDFVKEVVADLQAELKFWRVKQKPGRPLAFWIREKKLIFGIPGNPVSAMICMEEYVRPALRKMMGHRFLFRPEKEAFLGEDYQKSDDRFEFLRVRLSSEEKGPYAYPTGPQGSGILSSMALANGIALLNEGTKTLKKGDSIIVQMFNEPEDH